MFQIGLKNFFVITEVKNTVPWTYAISDLKAKEIVGMFCEKKTAKKKYIIIIQEKSFLKEFIVEKEIMRKGDSFILNGKAMIIFLIVGLIKKT